MQITAGDQRLLDKEKMLYGKRVFKSRRYLHQELD
jgi:hypothetical protein